MILPWRSSFSINKLCTLFLLIIGPFYLSAQTKNTGIIFYSGTLQEARAKAKAQHKVLFAEAFTDWCGPCKIMTERVFTDSLVGQYYNDNFICYRINMETDEGKELSSTVTITSYPTLIYYDTDGSFIFKQVGYRDPKAMIALGDRAKKNTEFQAQTAHERIAFENGSADKQMLCDYFYTLWKNDRDYAEVGNALIKKISATDLYNDTIFRCWFLLDHRITSPLLDYYVPHLAEFHKLYGDSVNRKLLDIIAYNLDGACQSQNHQAIKQVNDFILFAYKGPEVLLMMNMVAEKYSHCQ